MKLECAADPRAWAVVVDVWTRKMIREFDAILLRPAPLQPVAPADLDAFTKQKADDLAAYLRRVIKDAHMVDAGGNEISGVNAILAADLDEMDAAITEWWTWLPYRAYAERQKMGEAKRVN